MANKNANAMNLNSAAGVVTWDGTSVMSSSSAATGEVYISQGTSTIPTFSAFPQVSGLGIGASPGSSSGLTFDGSNFMKNFVDATSWTPTINFAGGTTGITYSSQVGTYSRIGNIVFIAFKISLSSKGSSTGQLFIGSLPITTGATTVTISVTSYSEITFTTNYNALYFATTASATTAQCIQIGSGQAAATLTNTNVANNSQVAGQGFYFID